MATEHEFANISYTVQRPQTQNSMQSNVSNTRKMLREAQSHKSYQQAELSNLEKRNKTVMGMGYSNFDFTAFTNKRKEGQMARTAALLV